MFLLSVAEMLYSLFPRNARLNSRFQFSKAIYFPYWSRKMFRIISGFVWVYGDSQACFALKGTGKKLKTAASTCAWQKVVGKYFKLILLKKFRLCKI
jgi:hypothetical protein